MNPLLFSLEDDLDTVDVVDLLVGETLFEGAKDAVDEGRIAQLDLVLRNEVRRVGLFELADLEAFVGEVREEERYADHCVAAGVDGGIDHAAVSFAADQGADLVHQRRHVDFAYCRSIIGASVGFGNIAERARRTKVGDRCDGLAFLLGKFAEVICHAHQRIFLDEGFAVLADEGQPVYVRVDAHAEVGLLTDHRLAELDEVGGKRLRVVGEITRRVAVERNAAYAEPLQ